MELEFLMEKIQRMLERFGVAQISLELILSLQLANGTKSSAPTL